MNYQESIENDIPYNVDDRVKQLQELAFIDESAEYEVDTNGIYYDPKTHKFVLLSCSGCSCWDGSYDEFQADSLDELLEILIFQQENHDKSCEENNYYPYRGLDYFPTIYGRNWLFSEAEKIWNEVKGLYLEETE